MKPGWIALLVFLAIGSVMLLSALVEPGSVEPRGSSGSTKSTQSRRRRETQRETKSTHTKSTKSPGIFGGADPSDPRIYH
jgi:hypothetical protein